MSENVQKYKVIKSARLERADRLLRFFEHVRAVNDAANGVAKRMPVKIIPRPNGKMIGL